MFGLFGKKQGPTLGLDINSSTISVIEFTKTKTDTTVSRFQSIPTPPDIVREGLLADPEAVGTTVKELLDQLGLQKKKGNPVVNIAIPGQAVVIRLMPVPTGMPPDELSEVVNQEAINNLPFPLDEANIDYCLLPATERTDPDGVRRVDVLLAAIQRIVVDSYHRMAEAAGVKLGHLDISSLAVIRALSLSGLLKDDGQLAMAVNIRNDATDITLTKKGMPLFSRSVLLGVETLGEAISRSIDVPMDEAISMLPKMNLGSVPTSDPKLGQAAQVARSVFGDLIAEVGRSLEFYMSQVGIIQVDQVLLTGPGCVVPGIDEFVSNRLNIPAEISDPFTNLIYDPALIPDDKHPVHAMLIGLVTDTDAGPMQTVQIDLNKAGKSPATVVTEDGEEIEVEEEADTPWFIPTLSAGVACTLLVLGGWGVLQYLSSQKESELAELETKVTEQQRQVDQMTKAQSEIAIIKQKKEVLEKIVNHGTPISTLLETARENVPHGVQLANFTVGPNRFNAKCFGIDFAHAAHFAINLQGSNYMDNVALTDQHRIKTRPDRVSFTISTSVNPEVAKQIIDEQTLQGEPRPLVDPNAAPANPSGDPAAAPGATPEATPQKPPAPPVAQTSGNGTK